MADLKEGLSTARHALINLGFCGPNKDGDGDPEVVAIDAALRAFDDETVARAVSIALIGDDVDWKQHVTTARRFMDAMATYGQQAGERQ